MAAAKVKPPKAPRQGKPRPEPRPREKPVKRFGCFTLKEQGAQEASVVALNRADNSGLARSAKLKA